MPAPLSRVIPLAVLAALAACGGAPYPRSDHYDGAHFHNPAGEPAKGLAAVLRWKLTSDRPPWQTVNAPFGPKPAARVGEGVLRVTFVNHATVLLQFDGLNVLTDPIFSERSSPFSWIGPKRVRPPGLRFEDLPPIDLVVVSHDHYDHLDLPTLVRVAGAHAGAHFIVPLGNAALLRDAGIRDVEELDWWQARTLPSGARVTMVPAQHFSTRGLFDRGERLWAGYVFETRGGPVFFAGDTAMSTHFRQVSARFGPMRLAVLPIGAYLPRWFMESVHIDPQQAVEAHVALRARTSVGMHFGTFQLADEPQDGAERALRAAWAQIAPPGEFWVLGFGEGRDVAALSIAAVP